MMRRALEIVDQYRPPDSDLISEPCGVGHLFLETLLRSNFFAWMSFPGVDEDPIGVFELLSDIAK